MCRATSNAGSTASRIWATSTAPGFSNFLALLAPSGTTGFVMANGSLSCNQSGEGEVGTFMPRPVGI